jgi:protocatechuate 3,4-dioxygenase beta subunit
LSFVIDLWSVVDGAADEALGSRIFIQSLVVDVNDQPIEDATVDLWQANAAGRYAHPRDSNPAPVDPNFQGWAIAPSGTEGEFRFNPIMPGAYPAARNWRRPPHIHFRIQKLGYEQLTTQMYFPGHELNNSDLLIARKQPREREAMIAEQIGNDVGITTFRYKIVLASS